MKLALRRPAQRHLLIGRDACRPSLVALTISGPGALVGLDAGDSTNHDSYKRTSHAAFRGKLMAIVQSTTTAGTITFDLRLSTGGSVDITTATP